MGWWYSPTLTIQVGTPAWTASRPRSTKWISPCEVYRCPRDSTQSLSSTVRVRFCGARVSRWQACWEQRYSHSGAERTFDLFTRITIDRGWSPQGIVFDMDGVLLYS